MQQLHEPNVKPLPELSCVSGSLPGDPAVNECAHLVSI